MAHDTKRTDGDDAPLEQRRPPRRVPPAGRRRQRRRHRRRRPEHQADEETARKASGKAQRRHAAIGASPDGPQAGDQPAMPNALQDETCTSMSFARSRQVWAGVQGCYLGSTSLSWPSSDAQVSPQQQL